MREHSEFEHAIEFINENLSDDAHLIVEVATYHPAAIRFQAIDLEDVQLLIDDGYLKDGETRISGNYIINWVLRRTPFVVSDWPDGVQSYGGVETVVKQAISPDIRPRLLFKKTIAYKTEE